jgi:hypothetical protein
MRRFILSLLLFFAAWSTAVADEFVGKYDAAGTDPLNRAYKGAVQIEQLGKLHVVLWRLEGGAAYKGIGIRQGDKLGVGWGKANTKFGVAVYKVNGGTLEGVWADSRDLTSELGKETLTGSPELSGTYKITLGQNRDGLTNYGGTIDIKRNGNTFLFYWPTKPPSLGVGVLLDDMLVVAYGSKPADLPGVVAYKASGKDAKGSGADVLEGLWATLPIKQEPDTSFKVSPPRGPGREKLTPQP